ncbi:MAG: hypothetical protein IPK58_24025 [Acidobacteria bacterium]|nr:hypothetical protein [Acidobacteriota bacterium]
MAAGATLAPARPAKSVKRIKAKISETPRPQSGAWADVRDSLNRTLIGWEGYFHYGSKRKSYQAVNAHVIKTVRNFLQRRTRCPRGALVSLLTPRSLPISEFTKLAKEEMALCRQRCNESSRRAGCGKSARPVR